MIFSVQLSLFIKNQFLIFQVPLQIYRAILIYGTFLGWFLDNLESLFS